MSLNTSKIFNDEGEYISLFNLSKNHRYSLEFLLKAAASGRLKSFKIGDQWLTTLDWFNDYNESLKKAVRSEITDQSFSNKNKWVDFRDDTGWRLRFMPQMFLILLIFSLYSLSLSWLVFSNSGNKLALSAHSLVEKKYVVGNYFLYQTDKVFSYNAKFFSYVVLNSADLAVLLADSLSQIGQETVYLAMVFDKKISPAKISDEIITAKAHQLMAVFKNKYRAVAGDSDRKKQIYFEEWDKSSR